MRSSQTVKNRQWNVYTDLIIDEKHHHHYHYHQFLNREGRWGTTYDFATSFLHFPLFSTALWDLPNFRPLHFLMLSSHRFLCLKQPWLCLYFMSGRLNLGADGKSSWSRLRSQGAKTVGWIVAVGCWGLFGAVMGVHGLWQLLHPAGKPVSPASLEGKVLAVGILPSCSWLHVCPRALIK